MSEFQKEKTQVTHITATKFGCRIEDKGLTEEKLMDWPPQSPHLKPIDIENLLMIVSRKVYEHGRQFSI